MLRTEQLQAQLIEAHRNESREQRGFIMSQLDYHRRLLVFFEETLQGERQAIERECNERIERVQSYLGGLRSNSEGAIAELESRLRQLSNMPAPPTTNGAAENQGA